MADLNNFNGTGRLGRDVEIRQAGDSQVANFSIAMDGHKKDDTTWLSCVAWNKQAEFLSNYAQKGSHLRVSGRIQVRQHNDKYYTEVVCYEVQILSGWKEKDSGQQQQNKGGYNEPTFSPDDDIPF